MVVQGRSSAVRAVDEPLLHAAAEHQQRARGGEVAVHAVVADVGHHVGHVDGLVLHFLAGLALGDRVAAELAGQHDQRAIEQAARLEVAHQRRHRRVDHRLHRLGALVAVLVRVPVDERNVLGRHFDVAGAALDQPPREQAAAPERAGTVVVAAGRRLEREVEAFAAGELSRRWALSSERTSDSRWNSPPWRCTGSWRQQRLIQLAPAAEAGRRPAPSAAAPPTPRPADRRSGTARARCRGSRRC